MLYFTCIAYRAGSITI